jgi:hypothetical protein
MNGLPENKQWEIEDALKSKGAIGPCPICQQKRKLQPGISSTAAEKCALVVCRNCGFIALHSLGALDIKL